MTVQEMLIAVSVGLRQLNSTQTRGYYDEEKLLALNNAQDRFIADKVRKVKGRLYEYDIVDQEAIDDLLTVKSYTASEINTNSILFPENRAYFIRASIEKSCGQAKITILKNSMVNIVNAIPFYRSTEKNYNAELINNKLTFVPHKPNVVIEGVTVVYIRKPKKIDLALNQSSELDSLYHQAIVDLAVGIMKVDNSQQDSQVKEQDNKINQITLG